MKARGITLLEMILALGLSSMLATLFLLLLMLGRNAFLDALDEGALGRVTYLVPRDLSDGLNQSRLELISYSPDLLTFASAVDDSGRFQTDASGHPSWQTPVSYWFANGKCVRGHRPDGLLVDPSVVGLRVENPCPGELRVVLSIDFSGYRRTFRGEVTAWAHPVN